MLIACGLSEPLMPNSMLMRQCNFGSSELMESNRSSTDLESCIHLHRARLVGLARRQTYQASPAIRAYSVFPLDLLSRMLCVKAALGPAGY